MKIIHFEKLGSTNTYAAENLESLEDKTLITAGTQTKGKGRNDNVWFSPENKNLNASYVIKTSEPIALQTSWIGGLAALHTVREIHKIKDLWIKWPNDIFCRDKKICGILCESIPPSPKKNISGGIIIGIGINVNCTKKDLASFPKPATSIYIEAGEQININKLYTILYKHLNKYYNQILNSGIESLYNEWKEENHLLGKKITVEKSDGKILSLKVVDINITGAIVGIDNNGNKHTIFSGDVTVKEF